MPALWRHDNAAWPGADGFDESHAVEYGLAVGAPTKSGAVTVFRTMGNASAMQYRDGHVPLVLTEAPVCVVYDSAQALCANVTRPAGYIGR
ncbi:hypothetical protein AWB79_03832 [Caballeronia hypogeia]|uniref:Uncharacterized protein n=1 Tax=Caballeronia hypogeia TaxID=1777140 RepID=A0A158BL07_9BURK|nr:hypothetical protein [Caballeronia hypogeia]SAK70650.1 hypothetical protein AWB79_03832 [Caballeronia hypogeia]